MRVQNWEDLEKYASWMRYYTLVSIHAAGSGHPGGSFSIMDITAVLYLHSAKLFPDKPEHPERDRIIFSAGHKAPAQYAGLGMAGFFPIEDMITLRKFGSPFQGHPHAPLLPGIEVSTGSLGQGLSVACGMALSGKRRNCSHRIFCIMGDGEQQEGSIWESAMTAGVYRLDNLVGIVDRNRLQIDGDVDEVKDISPLDKKYESFGWNVLTVDGHNMGAVIEAFEQAEKTKGKPTLIIAKTVKGKGVSFMENRAGWHGKATNGREELFSALHELPFAPLSDEEAEVLLARAEAYEKTKIEELEKSVPKYSIDYWWNGAKTMRTEMRPNREGFGEGLANAGEDERVVTIHADISDSIKISDFEKRDPGRKQRVFSAGIAEQDMITMAAGLAREGWIPVTGTYGVFAAGRPWDQIRTTVCYDNLNVKIIGAHGGISVGPDGGTHQALEDITLMNILPNMHLGVPSDVEEARKMTEHMVEDVKGPCYLRLAREATPVITGPDTPFRFGTANIIRFREEKPSFKEAFEIFSGDSYRSQNEDISVISCGPIISEVMRAAYILKREYGLETRIVNLHTVKPLDTDTIAKAVDETGKVFICEEHQSGGLGGIISYSVPRGNYIFMGINDSFGESGNLKELFHFHKISAEYLADKIATISGK